MKKIEQTTGMNIAGSGMFPFEDQIKEKDCKNIQLLDYNDFFLQGHG